MPNTIKNITALLVVLAVVTSANAATIMSEPKPVDGPNNNPTYESMLKTWEKGTPTNEQMLLGTWNLVVVVTHNDCTAVAASGYDPNGIKNDDGSISELLFKILVKGGNDFDATPGVNQLVVNLLNFGSTKAQQGPYEVDPNMPQFAQWAYSGLNNNAYIEYSCKAVQGSTEKLVCSLAAKIKDPTGYGDKSIACTKQEHGIIYGYKKVK